ncbi:IclR family transcriptional regulator [Bacillus sp. ISL-75]|uniref:IclR family transcriptional regulator n=1 Tax=Bacillus sp. ISL-75 TaxID=2819137 RepID=UPI001BEA4895|nr:IclR family transcriptional regulator [Bacillus sp. ISL-75]MBT2730395.1 IclR family transcriptional regulator [Bacillus sp. ISL-75]
MSGVIHKSMLLLTLLEPNGEKEDWSTTEISRELKIPVQTVHRLLNCLCEVGFVVQDRETRRFRLGTKIMELGFSIRENMSVRNASLPFLIKLSNETKENVRLSIAEGSEGVVIESVNSVNPIYNFNTGVECIRLPLSIDAANKVILANLSFRLRDKIITELTEKDIVKDRTDLEEELRLIKQHGFSITPGEKTTGLTNIAAPIFSWDNTVAASISLSINSASQNNQLNKIIDSLLKYANAISEELGWRIGMIKALR